jgi:hypothetical protein
MYSSVVPGQVVPLVQQCPLVQLPEQHSVAPAPQQVPSQLTPERPVWAAHSPPLHSLQAGHCSSLHESTQPASVHVCVGEQHSPLQQVLSLEQHFPPQQKVEPWQTATLGHGRPHESVAAQPSHPVL